MRHALCCCSSRSKRLPPVPSSSVLCASFCHDTRARARIIASRASRLSKQHKLLAARKLSALFPSASLPCRYLRLVERLVSLILSLRLVSVLKSLGPETVHFSLRKGKSPAKVYLLKLNHCSGSYKPRCIGKLKGSFHLQAHSACRMCTLNLTLSTLWIFLSVANKVWL